MDWMDTPVPLDAASAAIIAAGMKAVAQADGEIHARELELIESFEEQIPTLQGPAALAEDEGARAAYLRSLVMVALADGEISAPERAVIARLAADQGFDEAAVEDAIVEVKQRFIEAFAGVSVFREAVVEVARQLGLPEEALRAGAGSRPAGE